MKFVRSYRALLFVAAAGLIATVGADTFTDPNKVFKVVVPKGWKRDDTTFSEPVSGVSVDIKSISIPASKLDEWATATRKQLEPSGFKLIQSSKTTLGGQKAILIIGTLPAEGKTVHVELTLAIRRDRGVALTVAGLESTFNKDATLARQCTSTFAWL